MARQAKPSAKKKSVVHALPLTKHNYRILGAALVCIVLGYIALSQEPWDGFMPLYVAPILLFTGYCVLVPLGILFRRKGEQTIPSDAGAPVRDEG